MERLLNAGVNMESFMAAATIAKDAPLPERLVPGIITPRNDHFSFLTAMMYNVSNYLRYSRRSYGAVAGSDHGIK